MHFSPFWYLHKWSPTGLENVIYVMGATIGKIGKTLVLPKFYRYVYHTRAIITRSWFETALDYEPMILIKNFLTYIFFNINRFWL